MWVLQSQLGHKAIFPQGAISSTHQLNGRIVIICTTRAIQMLIIFNLNKSHHTKQREYIYFQGSNLTLLDKKV